MSSNFITVYNNFTQSHDGTDSYVELKNGLDHLIHVDKKNAAIYFILRGFAHSYVQLYADQAVTPDFAHNAKLELQRYLYLALQAVTVSDSPENSWKMLSEIVSSYSKSKKFF